MLRVLTLATAVMVVPITATLAEPPGKPVIVRDALGGEILGYDVDQNGSEGLLSEWITSGTQITVAVETFDQNTGAVKLIKKIQQPIYAGDFATLGVVGTSIGLVERQYSDPYIYKTTYDLLNPLGDNRINGRWTPTLRKIDNHIQGVSESQGNSTAAVLGENFKTFQSFVFGANIMANTSGPITRLTDAVFNNANYPVIALDEATNQAAVAAAGAGVTTPELAIVDLAKGGYSEFTGLGEGEVNGIAVDSADGIACTTTQTDFSIEFYDIATKTGFSEALEGATSDLNSGADVQFDSVNRLFLIGQQTCAGSESGSCVQVYDTQGNWVKSTKPIAGSFGHIAFNPNTRTGFLWLNDGDKFDELESFAY